MSNTKDNTNGSMKDLLAKYDKFLASYRILKDIVDYMKRFTNNKPPNLKKYPNCFNTESLSLDQIILINNLHTLAMEYIKMPHEQKFKFVKPNYGFAKKFNIMIGKFRKELCENSLLSGINYIPIVYPERTEIVNNIYDILTNEEIPYGEKKLRLDDGTYIKYEEFYYFSNCLNHYLQEAKYADIFFKTNLGRYMHFSRFDMHRNTFDSLVVRLNFKDIDGDSHYIFSDDENIKKLLIVSIPATHAYEYDYDYVDYYNFRTFENNSKRKISQLIKNEWNNKLCKFAMADCPLCTKESFIVKRSKFVCTCSFELCGKGCGKIFHGANSCDSQSDEMTAYLIKTFINSQCPGCKQYLEKIEGCNHMTCRCGTQYCNACGNVYEKDKYGHYLVDDHYDRRFRNGVFDSKEVEANKCEQFPNIKNATNIVLPTVERILRFV